MRHIDRHSFAQRAPWRWPSQVTRVRIAARRQLRVNACLKPPTQEPLMGAARVEAVVARQDCHLLAPLKRLEADGTILLAFLIIMGH